MAAKLFLVLCVAVFSVAFGMPSMKSAEEEPKEAMDTAETSHLHYLPSFSLGIGDNPITRGGIHIGIGGFGGLGNYQYSYGPRGYYGEHPLAMPAYPNF